MTPDAPSSPPRPRRFDLVVFDWDGTLFDSTALIADAIRAACADVGTRVPSEVDARYVIGLGLAEALQHAAPELPASRYRELADRYRHHYLAREDDVVLFEGTVQMLEALKSRGHRLGVATGKSRRGLDRVLERSMLGSLFDATRTADETFGKPHPQMLLELMDELAVGPERTLMIGDTTHDLQLAANAGCAAIGVGYGAHAHDAFEAHAPLFVAHSMAELAQWLERHA
ncbi:HAD family hydrolase [Piscinibacter koreensis]|uniref:HAD-IA family hydrolase n=1 Tax=Piscinibacter koreensis TaxID=2742824 RepID=A0A7Y6NPK2_9BURK|nr:HAD-IA family hydrolase [Schlegelella koreensis]NUZ06954.1 HAD-IA family hydrolase [Schlegelella koreensis]